MILVKPFATRLILATDWLESFNIPLKTPETVVGAVELLMSLLDGRQKEGIQNLSKEDLFGLHFGLGTAIRNAFELHDKNSKLLKACGTIHPDDASGLVITRLWLTLQNKPKI